MASGRLTKSQIVSELATKTQLTRKQVNGFFDSLTDIIKKQLGPRGNGVFVLPGLVKLRVVKKKATPEREGINPFTKERITIKAKPARKVVRATPVKALKELVG